MTYFLLKIPSNLTEIALFISKARMVVTCLEYEVDTYCKTELLALNHACCVCRSDVGNLFT